MDVISSFQVVNSALCGALIMVVYFTHGRCPSVQNGALQRQLLRHCALLSLLVGLFASDAPVKGDELGPPPLNIKSHSIKHTPREREHACIP